MSGFDLIEL